MNGLEIEIDYHNDRHWGMADNSIEDIEYHGLTKVLAESNPNSPMLNQVHNSIPAEYWREKLLSSLGSGGQKDLVKTKIELHSQFEGKSVRQLTDEKDEYIRNIVIAHDLTRDEMRELRVWAIEGGEV